VTGAEAKLCSGLSIAATVKAFEMCDVDDPVNYHALVTSADLDEVSLTLAPEDKTCLVDWRLPVPPHDRYFNLATLGVRKLIDLVTLMGKNNRPPPVS
jgi:hypothetical protein